MIKKIFLFMLLFVFFGCNENNELKNSKIKLLSVDKSDCKGNKSALINENDEKLIIRSTGNDIYTVQHQNVMFNCCLPAGLSVEVKFQNDTLFYTEKEKELGTCNCLCRYDLSGEIGNLEAGEYVLCLIKETIRLGTITLDFNNNLNKEILVSELKDYPYL